MSFLTDDEVAGHRVTRMIIHVVGQKDEDFVEQPEIDVQEEAFFRARIFSEAADGVHAFKDGSYVRHVLEVMARNEMTFQAGGQNLARRFFDMHVRQTIPGAFFVLQLDGNSPDSRLYALIKYDYREAVELAQEKGRSVLRAIVQAFVKERRAIQKFCIVRVRGGTAEKLVSASDRMKEAPDLTDYFERFLDVSRARGTEELSQKLNEALRQGLEDIKEHLPRSDVGSAVAKAKAALEPRATVSNDDVVDAVMHAADRPDDEAIRDKIEKVVRKQLKRCNLQDVEFRPDRGTLRVRPRRVVRTVEQVRIEFPDEELGNSVIRTETDDGVTFTIHTSRLLEDGTLPSKASKSS